MALFEDEQAAKVAKGETLPEWETKRRFMEIYNRCNPIDRQRIRDNIKNVPMYAKIGITPAALLDVDAWARQNAYTNKIKAGLSDLSAAVDGGANPERVAEIVKRLGDAQGANTREDWEKQLTATFDDELKEIAQQPDTIRTKWELGTIAKNKKTLIPDFGILRPHVPRQNNDTISGGVGFGGYNQQNVFIRQLRGNQTAAVGTCH